MDTKQLEVGDWVQIINNGRVGFSAYLSLFEGQVGTVYHIERKRVTLLIAREQTTSVPLDMLKAITEEEAMLWILSN